MFVLNKYYAVFGKVDRIEAERALKIAEEIFDYARSFIRNKEKS